jgi:type IX secretion system PorP/SprF family membrane protein
MKKSLLILFLLTTSAIANAQQDAIYSQYMYNHFVINPAYAGSRNSLSGVLMHRTRWLGMDGAPTTSTLSVHSKQLKSGLAWGANMAADRLGATSNVQLAGTIAYHLKMKRGQLAFGLRLGVFNSAINASRLEFRDQNDIFNTGNSQSQMVPSVDFGIYYYTRRFYAGLSLNHMNERLIDYPDWENENFYLRRYNTIGMGYAWDLNENFTLKPSLLLKASPGFDANMDINLSALFYNTIWFGISVRNQSTLSFLLDVNVTDFLRIGYAYDAFVNEINDASSGAHEVFIGFDLNKKEVKTVSTRYL